MSRKARGRETKRDTLPPENSLSPIVSARNRLAFTHAAFSYRLPRAERALLLGLLQLLPEAEAQGASPAREQTESKHVHEGALSLAGMNTGGRASATPLSELCVRSQETGVLDVALTCP